MEGVERRIAIRKKNGRRSDRRGREKATRFQRLIKAMQSTSGLLRSPKGAGGANLAEGKEGCKGRILWGFARSKLEWSKRKEQGRGRTKRNRKRKSLWFTRAEGARGGEGQNQKNLGPKKPIGNAENTHSGIQLVTKTWGINQSSSTPAQEEDIHYKLSG